MEDISAKDQAQPSILTLISKLALHSSSKNKVSSNTAPCTRNIGADRSLNVARHKSKRIRSNLFESIIFGTSEAKEENKLTNL